MQVVTFKKRNPEQYIRIYNLCDGEHTVTELAKVFNQDQGGLSRILSDWKELGIVYEISQKGGRFYKKIYTLEEPRSPTERKTEPEPQSEPASNPDKPEPQQTQTQG